MKKISFSFLFLLIVLASMAQYPVVDETVTPYDTLRPDNGPNGKRFFNSFVGWHFAIPTETNDAATVQPFSSSGVRVGWMWKHRVSNFFSVGYLLDFDTYNYSYAQNDTKTFPDSLKHKSQSISVMTLGTGLYFRFNFDTKRGNYIGHYLDAGGYADWNFNRTLATKDEIDFNQIERNRISRLHYVEKYQYGLYAAIGINKFTIFGRYRMSDIIKQPFHSAELPRLTVGIGLCLF
ncbi:MAG: hypothetical protein A2W93_01545 [Bacteroidetes bacterium GWF2_43_63]|nr:MAG: hypothetical protein A2W93_01545 [Bacteroidetes bacterium GWF2_43_63]